MTPRQRAILEVLERHDVLLSSEVARMIDVPVKLVADSLRVLWERGLIARSVPFHGALALHASLSKRGKLPPSQRPIVSDPHIIESRKPERIDPKAIAHAASVFRWGNRD